VFLLFFLFRNDFKAAGRVILGFAGASAVMWIAAPRASAEYWRRLVFETGRIGAADYVGNQSLRGLIARIGLAESAANLLWVLAAIGALTAVAVVRAGRTGQAVLALTACAIGGLLVSPVSWTHHWTWCVPILVVFGYLGVRSLPTDRPLGFSLLALTIGSVLVFIVAPMWRAVRPARTVDGWLATESYELVGLALLLVVAVLAGRIARSTTRRRQPARNRGHRLCRLRREQPSKAKPRPSFGRLAESRPPAAA
jgi:alpha-1,2-mannosyltransferase